MTEVSAAVLASSAWPLTPKADRIVQYVCDVKDFGALGDATTTSLGATTGGSAIITATNFFAGATIGEALHIVGGGAALIAPTDAQMLIGKPYLYSPSGLFTAAMGLRVVTVSGAGAAGGVLQSRVTRYLSPNWLVLHENAVATVVNATATVYEDAALTITGVLSANQATVGQNMVATLTNTRLMRGSDDSAAFTAALAAAAGTPGAVLVPAGKYYVPHVDILAAVAILGAGRGRTVIFGHPAQDTFAINTANNGSVWTNAAITGVTISGMTVTRGAAGTAGAAVAVGNANQTYLSDFETHSLLGSGPYEGVRHHDGDTLYIDNSRIANCVSHGIHSEPLLPNSQCFGLTVTDTAFSMANGGSGIYLANNQTAGGASPVPTTEGHTIASRSLQQNGRYGLELANLVNTYGYIRTTLCNGMVADGNYLGGIKATNNSSAITHAIEDIHLFECWASFNATAATLPFIPTGTDGHGLYALSVRDLTWTGGKAKLSGRSGIVLDSCVNAEVLEVDACANNQGGAISIPGGLTQTAAPVQGVEWGIQLIGTADNCTVRGVDASNRNATSGQFQSGITVGNSVTNSSWADVNTPADSGATKYTIPTATVMSTNKLREYNNEPRTAGGAGLFTNGLITGGGLIVNTTAGGGNSQAFAIADSAGNNGFYFRSDGSGNIQIFTAAGNVIGLLTPAGGQRWQTAHGATLTATPFEDTITLSTIGTTSPGTTNLLPANAWIFDVAARVTTAITGATTWNVGDLVTSGRFVSTQAGKTATGSTAVGMSHLQPTATAAQGPVQGAAGTLQIVTDVNASAGVVRVTGHWFAIGAPTS